MPVAAAISAFVMIAIPLATVMGIWGMLTLARVLFPPSPLPVMPRPRPVVGEAMPVTAREIGEALRRRYMDPTLSTRHLVADEDPPDPLADDLWMRRN